MIVVKRILAWGLLAFLIFFMAFRPDGAAQLFRGIGAALMAIAQGLSDFLSGLMA
ncbi:hypothetical protein O7602_01200 [Micromonospora sp. WMMD1128]|uniref:hypothetical protein n=1 Tax=unclassified Micromonospora TaxID=2617518 RepID=UPI00248CD491|nr:MULTISPECIES: hypothetical protein [unclassified Micromonospora]WBB74211.1 hypothetical protein O7602_01200 [Micromonospora sp. WMMD1128]WFE32403.1 hypothetical protein O7613_22905 [Micromonospora sp. WMMD975]